MGNTNLFHISGSHSLKLLSRGYQLHVIIMKHWLLQNLMTSTYLFLHFSEKLPGDLEQNLDDFQKLLLLNCLRPDKLNEYIGYYIPKILGHRFAEPQVWN